MGKNHYELWKNREQKNSYFQPFGCDCFILNTKENPDKFDSKALKCITLGYYEHSKGYRVLTLKHKLWKN